MASSGNFCVYNGLPYSSNFRTGLYSNSYSGVTNSGNTLSYPGNNCMGFGTMALTTGKKWYMEGIANNVYNTTMGIFEVHDANTIQNSLNTFYYNNTSYKSAFYHADGTKYVDGANSSYGATFAIGDIIGMAVDLESSTNTITFYKNNSSQGSFNLGTNGLDYLFCVARGTSGGAFFMNWGQDSSFGALKTAGGNADANGNGDFYYAPPSGHLALCSANLGIDSNIDPAQTSDDFPGKQFNAVAYTGTGSTRSVTGFNFKPDFVWIKNRASPGDQAPRMVDSTRGVSKAMIPSSNQVENNETTAIQSFDSDGFTIGSATGGYNTSSGTYIAWGWRANGGTTSSNSEGSITATVQANTASGFSIVTYTGNDGTWGSGHQDTYGHGLSKAPEFILCKERNATDQWTVFHAFVGNGGGSNAAANNLVLNTNAALYTNQTYKAWGGVMPTSSLVTVEGNTTNLSSSTHVSYIWHSVEGYSKFGSYVGNGNADGPFIYTGFRPRLLFVKKSSSSGHWTVTDTERNTSNVMKTVIDWNADYAEYTAATRAFDVYCNGFKIRTSDNEPNHSGETFVYGAWGDVPFKYNNTF